MIVIANVAMSGVILFAIAALCIGVPGLVASIGFLWSGFHSKGWLNAAAKFFWFIVLCISLYLNWLGVAWFIALMKLGRSPTP